MNAAQSTELKNMIQKAAPAIQGHLDKAQAIQRNMRWRRLESLPSKHL